VRHRARLLAVVALLPLIAAAPSPAYLAEVQRYYDSVRDICRTGVLPAMTAAWEQARRALDTARAGGGHDSNFAGIKSPTDIWLDCFQAPGDGKE
jgi:hypothetical protein